MSSPLVDFVKTDNPRSLFPLASTQRYIELGEAELRDFVYDAAFDDKNDVVAFSPSPIVFALKDPLHLRQVLLLDPIATFYIYDFVLRNWSLFRVQKESKRQYYGYAFNAKVPLDPFKQYHDFRKRKYELKKKYRYFAKVDISNCFNSFYHHNVVSFLRANLIDIEGRQFGQFLREINSGTSVNCFPQGIYPAKTIGNSYLSFSETSMDLHSPGIIRFLDDFFFFADNQSILERDIVVLQQLLGSHALFLNEQKTRFGSKSSDFEEKKLDGIKKSLLQKREETLSIVSGDENGDKTETISLEPEEADYLKEIIKTKDVAEEDVELALSLLKQDESEASILITLVLERYPNLIKGLYRHLTDIDDDGKLWDTIKRRISSEFITEYELFWLVRLVLDIYEFDQRSADVLLEAYRHPCASPTVQAAILEYPGNRYGLDELKMRQVRSGAGGIITASAVAGLEHLEKGKRNQTYKYISRTSPYLKTLCRIMAKT